ncbi:MAG: ammonium transporter [Candidatus Methanogranum gryphiswaldense]|nr:MAG: ammonium transporter [Candidatus Methanogranum sp. U3.2.1]
MLSIPGATAATVEGTEDSGSISWILVSSALVFIMAPGIALFYGGMLRKQSMSSMITQTLIAIGVMTLTWVIIGYSLAFSGDGTIIGNLQYMLMNNLSESAENGITSNTLEFAFYQMMFAIVTAAIVLGACAERVRYTTMVWFLALWSILVYAPMAHWVWGGGLFAQYLTVLDFAGGTVVHICAGVTGLAIVAFVGSRSMRTRSARAHNIPFAFLGCVFLWFGWFGFNGGSALAANGTAVHAVVVSQIAAACAMMAWAVIQYIQVGRVGVLGLIAGAIAGLVAITPAAGYVDIWASLVIGLVAGGLCYFAVSFFRNKTKIDDALDVFAVHGVGGIWGAIATGLFANPAIVTDKYAGLFYGGTDLIVGQLIAVAVTIVFCFAMSYAIIWLISKFMRVRVTEEEEMVGQDLTEHGEPAYLM